MVRSELIAKIAAENPQLTRSDADRIIRFLFDAITAQLADGGRVEVRGFGAFSVRKRDARMGRHPRTGEPLEFGAKSVIYFRASKGLRDRLNPE